MVGSDRRNNPNKKDNQPLNANKGADAKANLSKYEYESGTTKTQKSQKRGEGARSADSSMNAGSGNVTPCKENKVERSMQEGGDEEGSKWESMEKILEAVSANREMLTELTKKMNHVTQTLDNVLTEIQTLKNRADQVEERVSETEDGLVKIQEENEQMKKSLLVLENQIEDMQNRSRRANLRITGVPEGEEGINMLYFANKIIAENFDVNALSSNYCIERAHRVPVRSNRENRYPRPILIKLLNSYDKEQILKMAKAKPPIKIKGNEIRFFQDFAPKTQKKRSSFSEVRKKFADLNIPCYMIFPARLKIITDGKPEWFNTPAEAREWLSNFGKQDGGHSPK